MFLSLATALCAESSSRPGLPGPGCHRRARAPTKTEAFGRIISHELFREDLGFLAQISGRNTRLDLNPGAGCGNGYFTAIRTIIDPQHHRPPLNPRIGRDIGVNKPRRRRLL